RTYAGVAGAGAGCFVRRLRLGLPRMGDGSCEGQEPVPAENCRLSAMLDLADHLWAQGRLIAARKLEEQVVERRRRLLGEQHPDTLKAIGKLAVTLAAQGNLDEARRLQEAVVSGRRALFGDCDIETVLAITHPAGTI